MIPPGTKIICPNCGDHLATTNCILEQDEDDHSIYHDDFDWEVDWQLAQGKCPGCTASWSDKGGWVHTDHGWEEI